MADYFEEFIRKCMRFLSEILMRFAHCKWGKKQVNQNIFGSIACHVF